MTVAKRYARALYELAQERQLTTGVGRSLGALADAWEDSDELFDLFGNPRIGADAKRRVIRALAQRVGAPPMVVNAMQMLSDRHRLDHLPEIAEAFERLAERRSGRVRAEVVTATRLSDAYYTRLQRSLKVATGKDVILVKREDPSLIGGVVTRVGDRVFDGSLRNRLLELREQLLTATDPAALAER